jgi:hypothetical protein
LDWLVFFLSVSLDTPASLVDILENFTDDLDSNACLCFLALFATALAFATTAIVV